MPFHLSETFQSLLNNNTCRALTNSICLKSFIFQKPRYGGIKNPTIEEGRTHLPLAFYWKFHLPFLNAEKMLANGICWKFIKSVIPFIMPHSNFKIARIFACLPWTRKMPWFFWLQEAFPFCIILWWETYKYSTPTMDVNIILEMLIGPSRQ